MPPEVLRNEPIDFKIDVWSLGVILHTLISSYLPFLGENRDAITRAILEDDVDLTTEPIWEGISDECKQLISQMLTKDRSHRLSIDQVLAHAWFSDTPT